MKIKIEKSKLVPALKSVFRAVSTKNPLLVLTGIKFTASEDGKLALTGTDLEIRIDCTVQAEVTEPGSVVLPAVTVVNLIDKLPSGEVVMNDNNRGAVTIKYGKSESTLNGFAVDEYPEPSEKDSEIKFSIPGESLCSTMSRVVYAASDDATKGYMCSVNFEVKDGELVFASTDTHRLALGKVSLDGVSDERTTLVPKKAIEEVVKLFRSAKTVAVEMTVNSISFASDGITLTSNIYNGQFPNYKAVIPSEFLTKVKVKPLNFIEALGRASVLAETVVTMKINEDIIELSVDSERGRVRENMEASVVGASMKIGFNASYLIEAVKNASSGDSEVWIGFSDPLKPAMLKPVTGGDFLNIILPVRIREDVQEETPGQESQRKVS